MCIVAMTAIGTAAGIAMAAVSAAVGISQTEAQRKAANYEIEQAQKEAKKAEMEAAYERQEGVEEARKQKINAILNMADNKAKFAAGNIALSSSTVLNLENDTKINSELDALTTQINSEKKAQSYLYKRDSLYNNIALKGYKSKLNTANAYVQLGNSYLK